ncbi:GNAT family N-acetyltransferase [Roseovarius amoyensis]|uniref:GNAT family N-acetyltransferase n=1 Tax=Roseovarius amoyensis TaxID=2211448 RepID=UPI000DBE74EC|nr:GNAT family N-acetyltransferase [Roseovarius amoyensis]
MGDKDIVIRSADPDDEPAVRTCAQAAYAPYIPLIGKEPAPMMADFAAQIAASQVHVAEEAGRFAGFITFFPEDGHMFLEAVAVSPAAKGRGIGGRLIGFCEDQARRLELASVRLYTNEMMSANLSFYPHLGYVETGRRHEDGYDRVFFGKRLD